MPLSDHLKLKGYESLDEDLQLLLANTKCKAVEPKTDETVYAYECGNIYVPQKETATDSISFSDSSHEGEPVLEDMPSWFQQLFRTATAFWKEGMEERVITNVAIQMKKDSKKTALKDRASEYVEAASSILLRYAQQKSIKKEVAEAFEKAGWVIPYYLYWHKKEEKKVYTAIIDLEQKDSSSVLVSEKIVKKLELILQKEEYNEISQYEQINVSIRNRAEEKRC